MWIDVVATLPGVDSLSLTSPSALCETVECEWYDPAMRWGGSWSLGVVFLIVAALAGCLGWVEPDQPARVPDQAWADSTALEIAMRMERLWGHRFRKMPRVQMVSPDSVGTVLDSFPIVVRKDTVVRKVWAAIGLYRKEEREQVAAGKLRQVATRSLFVPRARRILLIPGADPAPLELCLAHEMVHAMQDEICPINDRMKSIQGEDEMVGYLGAMEGLAVYLAPRLAHDGADRNAHQVPPGPIWLLAEAIRKTPVFDSVPPALVLPSYAPYLFGVSLVSRSVWRHGLEGLDSVLNRPPEGSWQLWNPDDYLAGEHAVDWDTSWTSLNLPTDSRLVGQARIGEIRIAALLLEWDREAARDLLVGDGLGWKGDRLWVEEQKGRRNPSIVWMVRFGGDKAARRFAQVWWNVRGRQLGQKMSNLDENSSGLVGRSRSGQGIFAVMRQEREQVTIVDGFTIEAGAKILKALRKLPRRV